MFIQNCGALGRFTPRLYRVDFTRFTKYHCHCNQELRNISRRDLRSSRFIRRTF